MSNIKIIGIWLVSVFVFDGSDFVIVVCCYDRLGMVNEL